MGLTLILIFVVPVAFIMIRGALERRKKAKAIEAALRGRTRKPPKIPDETGDL